MDEFICNVKYQCSVTGELMLASTCDATFSKPLLLLMQQAHQQQCSTWLHRVGMLPVHRRWHSRSTGWAHCRAVCGWCKWPVRLYKVLPGMEPVDGIDGSTCSWRWRCRWRSLFGLGALRCNKVFFFLVTSLAFQFVLLALIMLSCLHLYCWLLN